VSGNVDPGGRPRPRPVRAARAAAIGLALAAAMVPAARAADADADAWAPLRGLAGHWEGEAAGFGGASDLTHDWDFVIAGQFLRLRSRSVQRRDDGPGEVHEDVGYVSRDKDRGGFVFRQFLSEGFVNTYDLVFPDGEAGVVVFEPREIESGGGLRARMRLTPEGADAYGMELALASPGKDFVSCQTMHLRRRK